jgi:hypothetical protein
MSKNIVLLSDGTGNSAAMLHRTNIWRIHQSLDLRLGDQIAAYDDGVGTENFRPLALLAGAVGLGLAHNVRQLYAFLCRNYEPGDRIYLFGFSRGAFTVRTLVGFIADQGLSSWTTEKELRGQTRAAWKRYYNRRRSITRQRLRRLLGLPRPSGVHPTAPPIAFVGVWDTVAAYGLPVAELALAIQRIGLWNLGFADRRLSPIVERACHALALDDERQTFHPVLWDESTETDPERIQQVWFTGAHSNVGGGYPKDELAFVSLEWMKRHAESAGLRFLPDPPSMVVAQPNPHGELYDSRAGLSAYYRYKPRRLEELCHDRDNGVEIPHPKIHYSVMERLRDNQVPYPVIGVPADYEVVQPDARTRHPGAPGAAETGAWARWRARRQERAWDFVFWRRLVYLLILATTTAIVLAPTWLPWHPRRACTGPWCFLDPPIEAIGALLPAFAESWLTAFRQNPRTFTLLAVTFFMLQRINMRLRTRAARHGDAAWAHVREGLTTPAPPPEPPTPVTRFRTSGAGALYRLWSRDVLPFIVMVLVLLVTLGAFGRVAFDFMSSLGYACTATPADRLVEPRRGVPVRFATASSCHATGIRLRAGERYAIDIKVDVPWADGDIDATPDGFSSLRLLPFLPMRRHWGEPWFRPMGRIGATGNDFYPLGSDRENARVEVRARSDGELFVFVNDVVWGPPPFPWWDGAYRWEAGRNHGTATLTVIDRR